ncbi:MAG TPA: type II toxin-antitoxin system VapC family toxin [Acidothermaceae bacterium]|nr:type II toxin-antitoxin system VapC family toxin [Acidothermaceae bacterium]
MFVIDTSVAMAWCFEDEATQATEAVLDLLRTDQVVVPAIWPLEVANVLLVTERRGRLSEAQASRFLELLAQLPLNVDTSPTDMVGIVATGRRHTLSSYDASYLLLAERLGATLATLDKPLAKAARKAGVQLLIKP